MGARPEDYERAAPYKSYIHVDQFSGPRELAEFLLELDKNDEKYNQYFQVKKNKIGKKDFLKTFSCSGKEPESSSTQSFSAESVPCSMIKR